MTTGVTVRRVDYNHAADARDLVELLNGYAMDPMGGGEALSPEVLRKLVPELAKRPHALSIFGLCDGKPVGLINAFEGFSSFAAAPLIYIHDVTVQPAYRGKGVAVAMLQEIERIAIERGACKITLEVLSRNPAARVYERFGFKLYELDPAAGTGQFMQKKLI
jgi:ribosomal protein S18 acetylase RimI-like enzyme